MNKIKIMVDGREVTCFQTKTKTKENTCIILPGATTIHIDYIPMMLVMKCNVIVINNPEHGTKNFKTSGPAITDANELIDFHVNVIKALIDKNYASKKVNIIGYSLGGMSLLNILNRKKLDGIIDKAVLLCSNIVARDTAMPIAKSMYNPETNTFATRQLVLKALTKNSPWFMYVSPISLVTANANSCYADCLVCEKMNELAKTEEKQFNLPVGMTAVIGIDDFFFDENDVPNLKTMFNNFNLVKVPNGHMLPIENFLLTAKIVNNAFNLN